jgi:hypothetical protein
MIERFPRIQNEARADWSALYGRSLKSAKANPNRLPVSLDSSPTVVRRRLLSRRC